MKYAVTAGEMKTYDRNTSEHFGVDTKILMERASLGVTHRIMEHIENRGVDRKYKALVFAGVGNNGGDGVCVARLLKQRGVTVTLCLIGDYARISDLTLTQLKIAEKYGITTDTFSNIRDNKSPAEWDIIVDALFGIGLSRPVAGDYRSAVEYINGCKEQRAEDIYVVSVDIPSGIHSDSGEVCQVAVKADETVTFNQAKIGHLLYPGCEYTGKLTISDAGITEESFLGKTPGAFYYDEEVKELLPKRKPDGNKGTNGKVLIIAGSKEISGAAVLCASACLKSGAGMVKVFTAAENETPIKTLLPEAMVETYQDFEPVNEKLLDAFKWSTGAVLGPGLGTSVRAFEIVKEVLASYDKDLVIDADALNLIAGSEELTALLTEYARGNKKAIITPHLGEFARLYKSDIADCKRHILEYPKLLADKLHLTVVCKDARSIVVDSNSKKIYINMSGNDGMATAGSGDVLAGILGAMLVFDRSSFEIASLGCYVHGFAGDRASDRLSKQSMIASDIIYELSDILI
ncbi:NAD(P)H-hydrate dehydratase [Butyrivibrio proteoclasticus]|uniref:NAD(P)H-hydrate dehydratase n=1 Tax=Butyrivibrio proteoclasticus TaxID=43305 RepID=UPI00047DA0E0|nr:NAD(P)H-hydrate dehydratase [Butyrivibrio proteoclasticus]